MTKYYHPATEAIFEDYLHQGFVSMGALLKAGRSASGSNQIGQSDLECRTLACLSFEDAVEYGSMYYGPNIGLRIIEIEGEYPSYPIKGTLVPEGTVFLLGEIPPENVALVQARKPSNATAPGFA